MPTVMMKIAQLKSVLTTCPCVFDSRSYHNNLYKASSFASLFNYIFIANNRTLRTKIFFSRTGIYKKHYVSNVMLLSSYLPKSFSSNTWTFLFKFIKEHNSIHSIVQIPDIKNLISLRCRDTIVVSLLSSKKYSFNKAAGGLYLMYSEPLLSFPNGYLLLK